jgi:hypothetical protein
MGDVARVALEKGRVTSAGGAAAGHIRALERRYPVTEQHRAAFRELGSEFTYAKEHGDLGVVLLRLSPSLEQMFGFTREILVFYSPYEDLQGRTFSELRRLTRRGGLDIERELTPDTAFLWAPDPRLSDKVDEWSSSDFTVIPLALREHDDERSEADRLLSIVSRRVFTRDLFEETGSVSGNKFFGRQRLLQALEEDIVQGRSFALFGLRKTGKTSVMRQLLKRIEARNPSTTVTLVRDLETLPSPTRGAADDLLRDLREELRTVLQQRGLRNLELADLRDGFSVSDFRRAMVRLIRKIGEPDLRIVVALDEVEYLCPPDLVGQRLPEAEATAQLLGALRAMQQETDQLAFVFSGVTSGIVERATLFGRPNPLLAWSKPYFLGPFDEEETRDLLVSVGERMGVTWTNGGINTLRRESGGHAYLTRSLASAVVRQLPLDRNERRVTADHICQVAPNWARGIAGQRSAIVEDLRMNYPDEADLLDLLLDPAGGFAEFAAEGDPAIDHLHRLGLVATEDGAARPSEMCIALFGLSPCSMGES